MICSKCATPIPPNGTFCPKCGEKMVVAQPMPAPAPTPQLPDVPAPPPSRRMRRRERRRHAQGFWYAPLVNIIILALTAAGWYFIPREISAYITDADFGSALSSALNALSYSSMRDFWENFQSTVIAVVLAVVLLVLTLMTLFAIYRLIKRWVVVSHRKKEWKKEKKDLLHKELSDKSSGGAK